jgi:Domain of unknown function (DUF5134)
VIGAPTGAAALALLAVAGLCAVRLVQASRAAARPDPRAAADVLMALAMAAMLAPVAGALPAGLGVLVFGLVAAGALAGALAAGDVPLRLDWLRHAIGGAAMLLMFAMPPGAGWTLLTWGLVAGYALFAVGSGLTAVRGSAVGVAAGPERAAPPLVLAPPVTSACHLVMAAGMVFLLLLTR